MRFVFYVAEKDRNYGLAEALHAGAKVRGDTVEIIPQRQFIAPLDGFDGAACLGVKRAGKRLLAQHLAAGQHFLFFDKSYMGRSQYVRVSIDSWQPLAYFRRNRPADRFNRLGVRLQPRRQSNPNDMILFAGSSQKYCNFHDLGDATAYAEYIIAKLRQYTKREIVYRPKPSWAANHPEECQPIRGTHYSHPHVEISKEIARCHLVATHGSNAAFDALAAGVPVMVLGDGLCKPMGLGFEFERIEEPPFPSDAERRQFFADAAYCQWTNEELANGVAWADLKDTMRRMRAAKSFVLEGA